MPLEACFPKAGAGTHLNVIDKTGSRIDNHQISLFAARHQKAGLSGRDSDSKAMPDGGKAAAGQRVIAAELQNGTPHGAARRSRAGKDDKGVFALSRDGRRGFGHERICSDTDQTLGKINKRRHQFPF